MLQRRYQFSSGGDRILFQQQKKRVCPLQGTKICMLTPHCIHPLGISVACRLYLYVTHWVHLRGNMSKMVLFFFS